MFVQLGSIRFSTINNFKSFNEAKSYNFAEHQRIENTPKLQYTGETLRTLDLKISFHSGFFQPEREAERIKALAQQKVTQSLVLGNGRYLGTYVIEEISSSIFQTDSHGNVISTEMQIRLKEWTGSSAPQVKKRLGFKTR